MTAGLLDARFEVVEDDAGLRLRGERALVQGARTLLGRPTPCVGRDWELTALTALFDQSRRRVEGPRRDRHRRGRDGQVAPRRRARRPRPAAATTSVAIWIGRGDSLRAGSTLDLLAQALRGALGLRGGEPLGERRARLRAPRGRARPRRRAASA